MLARDGWFPKASYKGTGLNALSRQWVRNVRKKLYKVSYYGSGQPCTIALVLRVSGSLLMRWTSFFFSFGVLMVFTGSAVWSQPGPPIDIKMDSITWWLYQSPHALRVRCCPPIRQHFRTNCARRVKVTRALNLCIMPCTVQKSCMIPSLQMVKSFGIFPKHHLYVRKQAISLLLDNIIVQFPPEEKSTLFQSPVWMLLWQ